MTRDMLKSILLLCQSCTTKTLLLIIVWQNRVPDYCKAVWGSGYYEIRSSVALPDDVPQDQGALQKRRSVSANISRHRSLIAGPIGAITIAADHNRIDRSDQSHLSSKRLAVDSCILVSTQKPSVPMWENVFSSHVNFTARTTDIMGMSNWRKRRRPGATMMSSSRKSLCGSQPEQG